MAHPDSVAEIINKCSTREFLEVALKKIDETSIKNGEEIVLFDELLIKVTNILRQYKSRLVPPELKELLPYKLNKATQVDFSSDPASNTEPPTVFRSSPKYQSSHPSVSRLCRTPRRTRWDSVDRQGTTSGCSRSRSSSSKSEERQGFFEKESEFRRALKRAEEIVRLYSM